MQIVMVGAGQLGLPVALAIESKGHNVVVVDPDPRVAETLAQRALPRESGADALLATTQIRVATLADALADAHIVFIAVQTPHDARFEGATRLPDDRQDFDYAALRAACVQVSMALPKPTPIAIISTVLPGTMEREILPHVSPERFQLVYNPSFVAMGGVIRDFLFPEFTLLGLHNPEAKNVLLTFYATIHDRLIYETSVRNAELIKVAYNTFIGFKLVFVNALMEICHKTGANVDAITDALCLATHRLISPAYLTAGMGDGGGCHPRDNIALSWLARELDLSSDIFESVMVAREQQTAWLAALCAAHAHGRPLVLLGEAYKRNSPLTAGSPARLLSTLLTERGVEHAIVDPVVHGVWGRPDQPACFFVAANHDRWHEFPWRTGDTVLDPWRQYRKAATAKGAEYVGVGA